LCGLAGIFDTTGTRPIDRAILQAMTRTLRHRGPDGEGFFLEPGIGLGHQRLSIIDIDGGAQPMLSADGKAVIIFNGVIYNFQALRNQLTAKGFTFKTLSDTEVLLCALQAWGPEGVCRLDGMFAFAYWDSVTQTLVLGRDRLGKKPLYYAELVDGQLLFGSELKALLRHPALPTGKLDVAAVADYFAYGYIPDPKTILQSVRKLPPANLLVQRRGQPARLSRYWDVTFAKGQADRTATADRLRDCLGDAVRSRLIADVPLGAFLSGGVDSSAIVAMMAADAEQPVKSFSIGFDDTAFDETAYARQVARQFATAHTERIVDPLDVDLIGQLVDIYDEPFGDSSALPTHRLAAVASAGVKVCLSGDGADEIFAGYRRYFWHFREAQVRGILPARIRQPVFSALARAYPKLDWAPRSMRAKSAFKELSLEAGDAYFNTVSTTDDELRAALFSDQLRRDLQSYRPSSVVKQHLAAAETEDPIQQAQYADLKTYLPGDILVKVDRASMANSLEVRNPFLDHRLVESALNLAPEQKVRGSAGKMILKEALTPYFDRAFLHRRKMGFSMPLTAWFRGPQANRIRQLSASSALTRSGLFNAATIDKLATDHLAARRDHHVPLWLLLIFNSYLERTGVC